MQQYQFIQRFLTASLIAAVMQILPSSTIARASRIEARAVEFYRPDTWPKSTQFSAIGFKLDDLAIGGFELREKRFFASTRGVSYIWSNEEEELELWTVVNVYASVEAAHDGMFDWLASGRSARMKRGSLSAEGELIGDISWADPAFATLIFARNNVVILILGRNRSVDHKQLIDEIAVSIDDSVRSESKTMSAFENISTVRPIITNITLDDSRLRVDQKTKLTVVAHDPLGRALKYGYYSRGGNILNTNEGVYYQATVPGRHEILVTVVNEQNIGSERIVSVTVLDD
ncbi:hypothetical protein ACFL6C_05330 [Myxococcota bacterium]